MKNVDILNFVGFRLHSFRLFGKENSIPLCIIVQTLVTFANSLDSNQASQYERPCLRSELFETHVLYCCKIRKDRNAE